MITGIRDLICFLFVASGFCMPSLSAQAEEIYILPSRSEGAHAVLASELKARLERSLPPRFIVHEISPAQVDSVTLQADSDDYIVTIGTQAMADVMTRPVKASLIATLLPKTAYESIVQKHTTATRVSAVYIDQPAARNIELVRVALPNKSVGILLSDASSDLYSSLDKIRRKKEVRVNLRTMAPNENLIDALDKVLRDSDVLLAFADPAVSNRNTAQHLLLTTYRRGIPMVAYSRAYVRAGALMAVYSTPEQYAQQTAEMLLSSIKTRSPVVPPQYPKYFSVEINESVAQSLGLKLPSRREIENRLMVKTGSAG